LLFGAAERGNLLSANMNVVLITGFCGGFTTFSTFADDMFLMAKSNNWLPLVAYVAVSLVVGFVLVWAGRSIVTTNV
jgi:CrcB protein